MTIAEYKPNLADLKIAIVGDIRHSRVANSLQRLAALLGVKDVVCVAPQDWQAQDSHARLTSDMQDGLQDADVVICLRVQKERIVATEQLDLATYSQNFAVTKQTLAYAKPDALLMHPGPINRGLEISSDVADGENSVILKQVENGVFMRMAIIDSLLS